MAVFTALTRAEAASFLTQFTIGELVELQGIASGIENTNFFLTTTQARYVLTIFERLTFKQLPFYLELMRHLARRGLPVPAPQENRSGALLSEIRGKPAAIVTRLEGKAVVQPTPAALRNGGRRARENAPGRNRLPAVPAASARHRLVEGVGAQARAAHP